MINKIRTIYPRANITPIDYDPGATRVNQENRIKLMLSVAKERLGAKRRHTPAGRRSRESAGIRRHGGAGRACARLCGKAARQWMSAAARNTDGKTSGACAP